MLAKMETTPLSLSHPDSGKLFRDSSFIKLLTIKKHEQPEQSLFRYGLDVLTNSLLHGFRQEEDAIRLWVLFLWPPDLIATQDEKVVLILKTRA